MKKKQFKIDSPIVDTINCHENDKKGLCKHRKMLRRYIAGTINPDCKWAKNRIGIRAGSLL